MKTPQSKNVAAQSALNTDIVIGIYLLFAVGILAAIFLPH